MSPVLPEDVIVEILSWLPVISLLRFCCVCKSWLSIIKDGSSGSFVTKHLQHYHNSLDDDRNARLLLRHYSIQNRKLDVRLFSDPSLADNATFHDLDFSTLRPLGFYGPCNGIICVCNGIDRLALWNPATRDFRPLPKFHPPSFPSKWHCNVHEVGFGLDLSTGTGGGDFKVVWIRHFSRCNLHETTYAVHVAVYTFNTDSWREFEGDFHDFDTYGHQCAYLNGTYYWWAVRYDKPDTVLAFDMSTDVFWDIPGPADLPNSDSGTLDVYQGSLTRLHVELNSTHQITSIDFWVMTRNDDDEVEEGCRYYWTKKLSVGSISGVDRLGGIWKNTHLFVLTSAECRRPSRTRILPSRIV